MFSILNKSLKTLLHKKRKIDYFTEGYNKVGYNSILTNSYIGFGSYIGNNCLFPNVKIGKFCSIANNIRIVRGTHPSNTYVSTHPSFFSILKQAGFTFVSENLYDELIYIDKDKKYFVEIGNDVWLGEGVLIMQGIKIGNGAIIGAGAIVTKDVAPYSINVGIPAKCIKYRFNNDQIKWLQEIKWWNLTFAEIKGISHLFNDIEKLINYFKNVCK